MSCSVCHQDVPPSSSIKNNFALLKGCFRCVEFFSLKLCQHSSSDARSRIFFKLYMSVLVAGLVLHFINVFGLNDFLA